jgi:hypothetical protein
VSNSLQFIGGRYKLETKSETSDSNQTNLNTFNNNTICNSVRQLEVEDRETLVKDLDFHLINTLSLDEQPSIYLIYDGLFKFQLIDILI